MVSDPWVQYRSNSPRTRKCPRVSERFSTLKPWNRCTFAPETKDGTSLAALNTARGFSATAPRTSTARAGAGSADPAAPRTNSVETPCPAACIVSAGGRRMRSAQGSVATNRYSAISPSSASPPRISACIIAFNEAGRLGDCLASLDFCDEVLVVDSFSIDATVEIARRAGARVLQRPFDGFRSQKQFAVEQAAHDWVLCLDADERIGPELRASLVAARDGGFEGAAGYRFARLSDYFGKFLRHGNAYPDRVLRLFDRRRGGWRGKREIHEAASVDGAVKTLRGDLVHYPYRSLEQQLAKTQKYARLMAEHDFARGKRASLAKLVLSPAWLFWRGYLLRGGFLDGWHGLVYAYVSANYVRQKTVMLWLLQNGQAVCDATATPSSTDKACR